MNRIDEVARLKEIGEAATQGNIGISRVMYEDGNHLLQLHMLGDRVGNTNFGAKHEDAKFQEAIHNSAPWLLTVAEQFHPGDSDSLESALIMVEAIPEEDKTMWPNRYKHATDCLRRILAAAKIMEDEYAT